MKISDWERKTVDELAEEMVSKYDNLSNRMRSDKKNRIKWKLQGRCHCCGGEQAKGKTRCEKCLARERGYAKKRRDLNRELGKCISCSRDLPQYRKDANLKTCGFCHKGYGRTRGQAQGSKMWS